MTLPERLQPNCRRSRAVIPTKVYFFFGMELCCRAFLAFVILCFAEPAFAAHSDIILSRANGVLRVDSTVHTGDLRENDPLGNGTIWATDNPGFAGNGFRFQDQFWFDITGPLKMWNGTNWSSVNVGPEFMQFVEPGPFGDPVHSVTITKGAVFAPGYQISEAGTRGSIHTHFVFILRATNGVAPAVGAYSFPITMRSPQYASAPPVHLVFNNGLEESRFTAAANQFRAAQEMRLTLAPGTNDTLTLSLFTVEGFTNQLESARTPFGPWTEEADPFVGDGGPCALLLHADTRNRFFRLRLE